MSDETPATAEGRTLHLVPEPAPDEEPVDRDPLLARAERIADLPLAERPAAFDGLNRAVVAELNALEEG